MVGSAVGLAGSAAVVQAGFAVDQADSAAVLVGFVAVQADFVAVVLAVDSGSEIAVLVD